MSNPKEKKKVKVAQITSVDDDTKWIKFLLRLICILVTISEIYKQGAKYMENNDGPMLDFREFNKTPKDKYPTYTICFFGGKSREWALL